VTHSTRHYAAFATVLLAFMMAILDTSIVNITLPCITAYFKSDIKAMSWVVNGFNLAFAVPLITASRLADQFGRKKIFSFGLFSFTLTSFLSGIAPSENWLIFFRVLQGLSAAALVPVTLPIVLELFPKKKRNSRRYLGCRRRNRRGERTCSRWSHFRQTVWQWIFYINIPVGCVALILSSVLIKESFDPTATRRIDWSGMWSLTPVLLPWSTLSSRPTISVGHRPSSSPCFSSLSCNSVCSFSLKSALPSQCYRSVCCAPCRFQRAI